MTMAGDWICPYCGDNVFGRNDACRMCGTAKPDSEPVLKPGDWYCPGCGDIQFAKNTTCRLCGEGRPEEVDEEADEVYGYTQKRKRTSTGAQEVDQVLKPGDWYCPSCGDMQFAKNTVCRLCATPRPQEQEEDFDPCTKKRRTNPGAYAQTTADLKPGDWYCPACGDLQFARNTVCRLCATSRPEEDEETEFTQKHSTTEFKPGDWYCPRCGDVQFAKNTVCRWCTASRPDNGDGGAPMKSQTVVKPGDWHCPGCGDIQFARNVTCRWCGESRPDDIEDECEVAE